MGGGRSGAHDEGNARSILFLPCALDSRAKASRGKFAAVRVFPHWSYGPFR